MKTYSGAQLANITFPLGGIGTGSVALAGNGSLVNWELLGRPDRESINPFSGFAIKAERDGRVIDWRFLQGDTTRSLMGGLHVGNHSWGYGHGPNRGTLAGMRHFDEVSFSARFPFAQVDYGDGRFPGSVRLAAFNPFIPSCERDSSIPAAMFEFSVTNTSDAPLRYTIALSAGNPLPASGMNEYASADGMSGLTMNSACRDAGSCDYGSIALATDCAEPGHQLYWYRGGWFDDLTMFMNDFGAPGAMRARTYDAPSNGKPDIATLTASAEIAPGQTRALRFVLSWYAPNCRKYWGERSAEGDRPDWRYYYGKLFSGADDAARYCLANWPRLYRDSKLFADALAESTLDECVLDAIQGNLCTLKSSTCLRLDDGDFYGWEGVNRDSGSCEGTCQHVWNYAYALPFLFPSLERGLRQNEMRYSLDEDGRMAFRMALPLGAPRSSFRACVDGQMGTVMKCYREWKLCGDDEWLRGVWPGIKKCIEYAWSDSNPDRWDHGRTGVMTGRQHHTLDVELFGAHSWLTGFYHGALLAGAEMARALGEHELADMYMDTYARGHEWLEAHAFNGRYYTQVLDIDSDDALRHLGDSASINMDGGYWDEENHQIKYQIGDGCEIDQVLADWHAGLIGLAPIFDPEHRRSALMSIYENNFVSMRDLNNPCRVFACNGERGVTMCAWGEGARKPAIPVPYSEEVMTGFEYAFAGSLMQCGMEDEALNVVRAIRERYDGFKRDPFSEIECGASYARAMSSYALLLIDSGFSFDMTRGQMGFKPRHEGRWFWSMDGAWGRVSVSGEAVRLEVLYGALKIKRFKHALSSVRCVCVNDVPQTFTCDGDCVVMDVALRAGDVLSVMA